MLHATAAPAPKAKDDEPLVEPDGPQPEPVQAFVSNQADGADANEAAPEFSFVAAPIQDDLLPQLPRRSGRRGRGAETAAPEVPAQVLRIAAAVGPSEPHGEPDTIVALAPESVQAAAPGAPPLPRRELDAASAAPPPRAPVYEPPVDEDDRARPNYELFAAFRAATDQGRADAVRGSDGGGA
jgi:hypothetical protein